MSSPKPKTEYQDGEQIKCQNCGKQVRVKWFATKQVVVVPVKERAELALRCQACGFITCDECAHPEDSLFTICPSCQREMGPYYFVSTGSSQTGADGLRVPLTWEQAMRMDMPQVGDLVAGEKPPVAAKWFQKLPMIWLMLLPFVVVLAAGLIYAILRIPAMLIPAKTAGPTATITLPAASTPLPDPEEDLSPFNNQQVSITGQIQPPANHDACATQARGGTWCLATLTAQKNSRILEVWILQGGPMNSISRGLELLSEDGNPIPGGSLVTLSGGVECQTSTCRIWAKKIKLDVAVTATPRPPTVTATRRSTNTPILTNTPLPTNTEEPITITATVSPSESAGCVQALSVTLADAGKELCVQGIVYETMQQDNAFLILFSAEKGTFYFVVYDRVIPEAKPGVCIRFTGKVQRLLSSPVIAPKFRDAVEVCP